MYNADYYYNMLRRYTATAELISRIRWEFIIEYGPKVVLDYGSGVGWFKAYAPSHVIVDTFDIAPYVQTGIRHHFYDVICFWDVLEHLPNFRPIENLIKEKCNYVALTIPMLPKGKELTKWKHFKPGEHLHYFTDESLDALFKNYGFKRIKAGYPECPPREDIESVMYGKEVM